MEHKFQEIQNKDRSNFQIPGQPCTSEHLQVFMELVQLPGKMAIAVATDIFPTKIALVVTLPELILMQRNISGVML